MSIMPVGGSTPDWASIANISGPTPQQRQESVLSSVGNLLGSSSDDLKTQLASGQSLSDIAQSKGVSRDDLLSAIKTGLQNATGTSASASANLDQMATRIADRVPHAHHGHHGHHHGGGASAVGQDPVGSASASGSLGDLSTGSTGSTGSAGTLDQRF